MRNFYSTEEAIKDGFLFVSYSHDDRERVKNWVEFLIDNGVRVWWDKAFLGGDDWETIAESMLAHENCRGILFFCSKSAIRSLNVAKEWRKAAETKENRTDDSFYPQIIMVDDDPEINYKYLTNFVKKTEELFSDDDYDDFRSLFGKKDHLFYSAHKEDDKSALLETIKERASEAMDEYGFILDKLADISNAEKNIVLKLGSYGIDKHPVLWRQIGSNNNETTLLCQSVLEEGFGGRELDEWLNSFVRTAFSNEEQNALCGKIRLLTIDETSLISQDVLAADKIWWLTECEGNLQAVVREDGTVYKGGYNNKLYKKGIRPAITIDSIELYNLIKK